MTFLSIIKGIGKGFLGIEKIAAPVAELVLPQFAGGIRMLDNLVQHGLGAMLSAETASPSGGGALKSAAVTQSMDAALELTKDLLASEGKDVNHDAAKLQNALNLQTQAFAAWADWRSSVKIVPKS